MEEEGDGIKRSQECVILVMIEMISAGAVWTMVVMLTMITINDKTQIRKGVQIGLQNITAFRTWS